MISLQCWLIDKWARFPLDTVSWLTTNSRSWTITSFAASPSWHGCEWRSINYFTKASSKPTTCVSLSTKSHCTIVPLKCLWKEIFAYFFILNFWCSMILWFVIFEFGLRISACEFFRELQSWPIRVKMCDIPHAVKICKLVRLTS